MPQQIGPAMLANLETQLNSGEIDRPTYDARRLEVEELIRKGKAYSLSPQEKTFRSIVAVVLIVVGLIITLAIASAGGTWINAIIPLAAIAYGIMRLANTLRH